MMTMNEVSLLRPAGLVNSPAYSHVAVVPPGSTTIHVGGQNAVDPSGELVGEGDPVAQMTQVIENLRIALAAADATLADVLSWQVFVVDGVDLSDAYRVVADALDGREPPLVTVAVVAKLAVPGALMEVGVTAAVKR